MPRSRRSALGLLPLVLSAAACAQPVYTANFDSLVEGGPTLVLAQGGLTFSELDRRLPGEPPPHNLVIENAAGTLAGQGGFTSPNTLGFGGYSPGPGASFTRFGSMRITPDTPCTQARVHVYEFGTGPGNSVTLVGYMGGIERARVSLPIQGGFVIHHFELVVAHAGGFDQLRLMGEGPNNEGVFFGLVDSVTASAQVSCYPNCDQSTVAPVLNVTDFTCFLQRYAAGSIYANCDLSTVAPVLNVSDFTCFLQRYAAGCP